MTVDGRRCRAWLVDFDLRLRFWAPLLVPSRRWPLKSDFGPLEPCSLLQDEAHGIVLVVIVYTSRRLRLLPLLLAGFPGRITLRRLVHIRKLLLQPLLLSLRGAYRFLLIATRYLRFGLRLLRQLASISHFCIDLLVLHALPLTQGFDEFRLFEIDH